MKADKCVVCVCVCEGVCGGEREVKRFLCKMLSMCVQ